MTLVDKGFYGRSGTSSVASRVFQAYMEGDDLDRWVKAHTNPMVNVTALREGIKVTGDLLQLMDKWGDKWIKEMINRGGINNFPIEIENTLAEHPKIIESALVGLPNSTLGEIACLCMIPTHGSKVTQKEIAEFLRTKELSEYKIPARVMLFTKFPLGQTMRVNRRQLTKQVITRLGSIKVYNCS